MPKLPQRCPRCGKAVQNRSLHRDCLLSPLKAKVSERRGPRVFVLAASKPTQRAPKPLPPAQVLVSDDELANVLKRPGIEVLAVTSCSCCLRNHPRNRRIELDRGVAFICSFCREKSTKLDILDIAYQGGSPGTSRRH